MSDKKAKGVIRMASNIDHFLKQNGKHYYVYHCPACGKDLIRVQNPWLQQKYIKSFCETTGRDARIVLR
jgi:predicted RNA-binding Zn-ribbon protein involved in translation (DUF1610 family)